MIKHEHYLRANMSVSFILFWVIGSFRLCLMCMLLVSNDSSSIELSIGYKFICYK